MSPGHIPTPTHVLYSHCMTRGQSHWRRQTHPCGNFRLSARWSFGPSRYRDSQGFKVGPAHQAACIASGPQAIGIGGWCRKLCTNFSAGLGLGDKSAYALFRRGPPWDSHSRPTLHEANARRGSQPTGIEQNRPPGAPVPEQALLVPASLCHPSPCTTCTAGML